MKTLTPEESYRFRQIGSEILKINQKIRGRKEELRYGNQCNFDCEKCSSQEELYEKKLHEEIKDLEEKQKSLIKKRYLLGKGK